MEDKGTINSDRGLWQYEMVYT